jgi:hypothetical protein
MAYLVDFAFDFIKENILFRPLMELRNSLEEIDFYSFYLSINFVKKWKNNSNNFVILF